jgi:hypothetical protein
MASSAAIASSSVMAWTTVALAAPTFECVPRRLIAVDEAAVVADYEADVLVNAICATHQIPLNRLYRILDRYEVPRRQPNAPKLPKRLRRRILADYAAGVPTEEIAHRHSVSHGNVSNIAAKDGVLRNWHRSRDDLVELVVRWFVGDDTTHEKRRMITRLGCRTRQPGLRSLADLDPAIADDVRRRLADVLRDRFRDGP